MIDIDLAEILAAAQPSREDAAEKIAFKDIPGPPVPGIDLDEDIKRPDPHDKDH